MRTRATLAIGLVLAMLTPLFAGLFAPLVGASSHREAPLIANDPAADGTDFYMFRSPDDPNGQNTVTLLANYIPLQPRYGGPNFHHPADEVLYSIKIDNDGDAQADIVYQFRFMSRRFPLAQGQAAGDTYLYNSGSITALDDPNLLFRQYYTVTRIDVDKKWGARWEASHDGKRNTKVIASGQVMPAFVGKESYCPTGSAFPPNPACTEAAAKTNYENIVKSAIYGTKEGGQVFVGPRTESFYVDLAKVFDLARLGSLGYGAPTNNTAEFNITSLAIKVPVKLLLNPKNNDPVIGGWTTSSRRATQIIGANNERRYSGPWRQVSRLGSPLVNEVVIGAKDKDKFNAVEPKDDVNNFGGYVVNPRLAAILNILYPGVLNAKQSGRGDLVQIFVSGIPGLTRSKTLTGPGEMLRLNTATPVTPADSRSDLGVVGNDPQGFPNGRRVTDDVTDIELTAVSWSSCSGPSEGFGSTLPCTGVALGDGVGKDGLNFLPNFPYLPTPHSGTEAD
jgi:Domain of unknown function (DUF4331)